MFKIVESRHGNIVQTDGMKCSVLIETEADVETIPAGVAAGSFAYTPDFSLLYCKGLDGKWHKLEG